MARLFFIENAYVLDAIAICGNNSVKPFEIKGVYLRVLGKPYFRAW